jgi:hypothetical protein
VVSATVWPAKRTRTRFGLGEMVIGWSFTIEFLRLC